MAAAVAATRLTGPARRPAAGRETGAGVAARARSGPSAYSGEPARAALSSTPL
jgi:hypothetical protein